MSNTEAVKRLKAQRKAAGICVDCTQPATHGRTRCEEHHERNALSSSLSTTRKILSGEIVRKPKRKFTFSEHEGKW